MDNYYLGLSFEPTAVGWAVTDENYCILRRCGKDMWGTHGFERAETAVNRRAARNSRRRVERSRARIGLLRSYFMDAIDAVDPDFFTRLDNSKYFVSDKEGPVRYKHVLFHDKDYTDVDYKKDYPTIFHLRKALLDMGNTGRAYDVRLVYLALANMFKHRGNFYMNISADKAGLDLSAIRTAYEELLQAVSDSCGIMLRPVPITEVLGVLTDDSIGKRDKAKALTELFRADGKDKRSQEFLKCLCGSKTNVSHLFPIPAAEEEISVNFSASTYEDDAAGLESQLGAEYYGILEQMKGIYDFARLQTILRDQPYISIAQVDCYERHAADLACLKAVYKKYLPSAAYRRMFVSNLAGTYSAYVNGLRRAGKRDRRGVGGSRGNTDDMQQAMYKMIKKDLSGCPKDDEQIMHILSSVDCGQFLKKQRTNANSVIPNQVYAAEMRRILERAENYLPFLNDRDSSGLTVSERILSLFSFCMPYYVGPTGSGSKTGWAVRKEQGQIFPWNIEEKIDMQKTSEQFITNLIRSCTYVAGEKVLPRSSLLYEKFTVLNTLNSVSIDGERISPELKKRVYTELFMSGRKITKKGLCSWLIAESVITSAEQVSGVPDVIGCSLASYRRMKDILGDWIDSAEGTAVAEDIIYWGTIYGESRRMFRKHLDELHGAGKITKKQSQTLAGCRFNGWGRLSRAFLQLHGQKKPTDTYPEPIELSIMDALWEYDMNLAELISSDAFTFRHEILMKRNRTWKTLTDVTYEDLDEFGFSAPVRRMVWRTVLVTKEIIDVMGAAPKRVFVQMARVNEPSSDRNVSRLERRRSFLLQAYSKIPDTGGHHWKEEIEAAADNGLLIRKKVYLYFCQMGQDLYTGKEIPFDAVTDSNSTEYNIDHVYPKHYVCDSSTENNLVLVNEYANAVLKSDRYPVPMEIWDNSDVRRLWDTLHRSGLMNDEKYTRLTSRKRFDDRKLGDFIAAQMIEVNQGAKSVATLLKDLLPKSTEVVYVKESNVAAFRQQFNFPRVRIINEVHHAQQAYLNIVVGNVFFVKFTSNPWQYIRKDYASDKMKYHYNLSKMYDRNVYRDGYTAWSSSTDGTNGSILTVRKMMSRTSALLTRMTYVNHGALSKATIYPSQKANEKAYFPIKSSDARLLDVTKYGGVTAAATAYFFLVSHEKKHERILSIEPLPAFYQPKAERDPDWLRQYCEVELGYKSPRILRNKILLHSVIEINGYRMCLSGKSGGTIRARNAEQMYLPDEQVAYVKHIEKHAPLLMGVYKRKPKELSSVRLHDRRLSAWDNLDLYDMLTDKYRHTLFSKRPGASNIYNKLQAARERFIGLSLPEQCLVLYQILLLSRIGTNTANMTLVGESANFGIISFSQRLDCEDNRIFLISQSVTGLRESKKRLVPDR